MQSYIDYKKFKVNTKCVVLKSKRMKIIHNALDKTKNYLYTFALGKRCSRGDL